MFRSLVTRGAIVLAVVAVPAGAISAGADDSDPDDTTDESAPESAPPESSSPPDDTTSADDGSAAPPEDMDFQIDMMLGLVPDDEIEQYYEEQSRDQELAIQACMNEAGFEYNPQDSGAMMSFDQYNGLSQLGWAQQWGFGMWTTMDPENNPYGDQEWEDPNADITANLSEAEVNAWYQVNMQCSEEAWTQDDPWSNPMVQQAMEDFNTTVENDSRMQDALATWVDCMAEAGHPFANQQAMYDAVYGDMDDQEMWDLQSQFYESEAWEPTSPDHAEWQALVDEEIEIAVADATCSPPLSEIREAVVQDLRPELVAVWQTVDWSLPPVTYPEMIFGDGGEITVPEDTTAEEPDDTDGGGLDLGDSIDTSVSETTEP